MSSYSDIEFYDDENAPKSLYVGHLHPKVTEELLTELFSKYGDINSCKLFPETPGQDPYAFVEYTKREDADHARAAMNDRVIFGKNIAVRFATNKTGARRDLSSDYHIFVGDLSPEIRPVDLVKAFQEFGKITSVRIMKDINTGKSKGFAFLSYQSKQEAEKAIDEMSGAFIGSRQIRTNWASRKGPGDGDNPKASGFKPISLNEAMNSASNANTTVYLGNLPDGATEGDLRGLFTEIGTIQDVKLFLEKRFSFVRMTTHEEAAQAISTLHGTAMGDSYIKCFWGKEFPPTGNSAAATNHHQQPPQQMQGAPPGQQGQGYDYQAYVQNYWNQYYQQYYQCMDPNSYAAYCQQYGMQYYPGQQGGPPQGPPQGAPAQGMPQGGQQYNRGGAEFNGSH